MAGVLGAQVRRGSQPLVAAAEALCASGLARRRPLQQPHRQWALLRRQPTHAPRRDASSSSSSSGGPSPAETSPLQRWWKSLDWAPLPVGVGIALIAYQQYGHTREREERKAGGMTAEERVAPQWAVNLLHAMPLRALSRLWGWANERELPVWARKPLLGLYAWAFDCNLDEALDPDLTHYSNLQAFFGRELKPGVRPVEAGSALVSPADSRVLCFGQVAAADGSVEQVKGVTYSTEAFLGQPLPVVSQPHHRMFHIILYLAPGDYHHYHSPAAWKASLLRHIPGDLFSVSPGFARLVKGLFSYNERAILLGEWEHGFFSYAAVGATNVGSIEIAPVPELKTDVSNVYDPSQTRDYDLQSRSPTTFEPGSRVGAFHLGSTIILLFEAPEDFRFTVTPGQKLKYGQRLGAFTANAATGA